jgi:hypothetical protein
MENRVADAALGGNEQASRLANFTRQRPWVSMGRADGGAVLMTDSRGIDELIATGHRELLTIAL